MAEDKVGWSFLQDIRNRFSVDGKWWLWKRVYKEERLRRRFVAPDQTEGQIRWKRGAITEYEQRLVQFQEQLLVILFWAADNPYGHPNC